MNKKNSCNVQRLGLSDFDHIDPVCEAVNKNIHREDGDWLCGSTW